jgi:hypothetical protein
MEQFSLNMAKSLLGRNVNLHLRDGSVIINVQLTEIQKDEFNRENFRKICSLWKWKIFQNTTEKHCMWAELINLNLIQASG